MSDREVNPRHLQRALRVQNLTHSVTDSSYNLYRGTADANSAELLSLTHDECLLRVLKVRVLYIFLHRFYMRCFDARRGGSCAPGRLHAGQCLQHGAAARCPSARRLASTTPPQHSRRRPPQAEVLLDAVVDALHQDFITRHAPRRRHRLRPVEGCPRSPAHLQRHLACCTGNYNTGKR